MAEGQLTLCHIYAALTGVMLLWDFPPPNDTKTFPPDADESFLVQLHELMFKTLIPVPVADTVMGEPPLNVSGANVLGNSSTAKRCVSTDSRLWMG